MKKGSRMRVEGKVAFITGAGSGLGRASALRFAEEGAKVVLADLDEVAVQAVAAEIMAVGGEAIALEIDVTSFASTESAVAAAASTYDRIDIAFANAGIGGNGNAHDLEEEQWDRVIDVNLKGVWLTARHVLPIMQAQGSGSFIAQASMGGLIGLNGIFPYTAAKGGVISMTKQMAIAYGPDGIRVNAICPGTIPTPLVYTSREGREGPDAKSNQEIDEEVALRFPLRRLGEPNDVANMAVFLGSDESKWVTGGIFPVDGGRSAT